MKEENIIFCVIFIGFVLLSIFVEGVFWVILFIIFCCAILSWD